MKTLISLSLSPRDVLKQAGQLSEEAADGNHPGMVGIGTEDGTFAGGGELNMDAHGNVVLVRVADDMDHLSKGWKPSGGIKDLLETSEFHGGGKGIPTSGLAKWTNSFRATRQNTVGIFRIPAAVLLDMIRSGDAILGNLGEGEFVLNPAAAKPYLAEVDGKPVGKETNSQNQRRPGRHQERKLMRTLTTRLPAKQVAADDDFNNSAREAWDDSLEPGQRVQTFFAMHDSESDLADTLSGGVNGALAAFRSWLLAEFVVSEATIDAWLAKYDSEICATIQGYIDHLGKGDEPAAQRASGGGLLDSITKVVHKAGLTEGPHLEDGSWLYYSGDGRHGAEIDEEVDAVKTGLSSLCGGETWEEEDGDCRMSGEIQGTPVEFQLLINRDSEEHPGNVVLTVDGFIPDSEDASAEVASPYADFKQAAENLSNALAAAEQLVDSVLPDLFKLGMGVQFDEVGGTAALELDSGELVSWEQVTEGGTHTGENLDVEGFKALFPTADDLAAFLDLSGVLNRAGDASEG